MLKLKNILFGFALLLVIGLLSAKTFIQVSKALGYGSVLRVYAEDEDDEDEEDEEDEDDEDERDDDDDEDEDEDEDEDRYKESDQKVTNIPAVTTKPVIRYITLVDPGFNIDTDHDGLVDAIDPNPTISEIDFFTDDDGDSVPNALDTVKGADDYQYMTFEDTNSNGILDSLEK